MAVDMKRFGVPLLALVLTATSMTAQQFGGALAVNGDQVFVGETGNQNLPGIVYVYESRNGTWTETAQLLAGEHVGPPDGFGRALITDGGGTLYIGAPMNGSGGSVHMFTRGASGNWGESARIGPTDGGEDDRFGSALATAGDVLLVSAPGQSDGSGAVYVFRRTGSQWNQVSKLTSEDDEVSGFGSTLAFDGSVLLLGTREGRDAPVGVFAYQWNASSGAFTPHGRLEADGLGERSGFGSAIALSGGVAYVSAPGVNQRTGAVLAFSFDATSGAWAPGTRLSPYDAGPNTGFGSSIVFDNENEDVWIGAPGAAAGEGAFYVFARNAAGDFTGVSKLSSHLGVERAAFSNTAALAGDIAVVGAAGVDGRAGAAVVLERGTAGAWIERNSVVNEMRGFPAITGGEAACSDNHVDSFECSEVNVVSFLPLKDIGGSRGTRTNDIWGWTDPETGTEYAIVGRSDGTSFVDLSDPLHPLYVGDLPKTAGSRSSVWRDMKVYRDHVYIVADAANEHGVQVFDLTQLRSVRNPPVTFEPTYTYDGIHSAHNIVINEETGHAYAVGNSGGGETCGGGLHMMNLETPSRPTFAGCFADATTGRRKTGYSHDAQCVRYRGPDAEHQGKEVCFGSNETALSIADVSDKGNPVALAAVSYPNVAYTHQGWLTEDHRHFYMNDEGDEPQGLVPGTRTLVWDVSDLDDPILVNEHIASTTTTDHNLYVRGNLMYQSNYGSGLRVLDVSDPVNPAEVGFFDTTPFGGSGSWSNYPFFESGLVIVTSGSEGLFVLKPTALPVLIP